MGFRITPDMYKQASTTAIDGLRAFAKSIRCIVVGDQISCNRRQQVLLQQWWKEHKDD